MASTPILSRRWIREVDRRAIEDYGMSGLVLMENAARGVVDVMQCESLMSGIVVVCSGRGNNGGDGFAIARRLDLLGAKVRVVICCEPESLRGDAAANFAILKKCEIPIAVARHASEVLAGFAGANVLVDALLGTGSTGDPRQPISDLIEVMNQLQCHKIAVDIPSGLDCDTGEEGSPTFRADHTVTFVAPKAGLLKPQASMYVGKLHVVDIGAPRVLVERILREASA